MLQLHGTFCNNLYNTSIIHTFSFYYRLYGRLNGCHHILVVNPTSSPTQVFVRQRPELKGVPLAVIQYSDAIDGGTSAIAVSYEARKLGVKRGMRKKDIIAIAPQTKMVLMPHHRGKADLTMFRAASSEVMAILAKNSTIFERASIDEAYIDITANVKRMIGLPINKAKLHKTYVAGYEGTREEQINKWSDHVTGCNHHSYDYKITLAAVYVNMIRDQILSETQFTCSAGIGANKIVAKLAAGTHKPDSQTMIHPDNIPALYRTINFTKIRNFGGKLGTAMQQELGIQWASELVNFAQADLITKYGDKTGQWIYNIARGIDHDPVKQRALVKQSACAKNFPQGIKLVSELEKWVSDLAAELEERLAFEVTDNKRLATQFITHLKLGEGGSTSTQMPLVKCDLDHIVASAHKCINKKLTSKDGAYSDVVFMLSIGAGKFVPAPEKNNIYTMLRSKEAQRSSKPAPVKEEEQSITQSNSEGRTSVDAKSESHGKKPTLSGFFEKLRCEVPTSSRVLSDSSDQPAAFPGKSEEFKESEESVRLKENNKNSWNSLSEEDAKLMLEPIEGAKTRCPVCNKPVLESKLSEHLDFHTALTLQRKIESELRSQDTAASPKRKIPQAKKNNKKRKVSSVQSKNIASFFKKI